MYIYNDLMMIISPINKFLVVIFYQSLVSIFESYNRISYLKFLFFEEKSLVNRISNYLHDQKI